MNQHSATDIRIQNLLHKEVMALVAKHNPTKQFLDDIALSFDELIVRVIDDKLITPMQIMALYNEILQSFLRITHPATSNLGRFTEAWNTDPRRKGGVAPTPAPPPLTSSDEQKVTPQNVNSCPFSKSCVDLPDDMVDSLGQTENVYVAATLRKEGIYHILMFNRRGLVTVTLQEDYAEYDIQKCVKFEEPLPAFAWLNKWIIDLGFEEACSADLITRIMKELKVLQLLGNLR